MEQLHFLHPLWLIALIPLAILWWFSAHSKTTHSKAWEKVIDARLLPLLLNGSNEKHNQSESLAKWLLAAAWAIATVALADPVWEKTPRPIFQTNSARVIVLDLSNSMQIDDLKPSRLARARFKIEDILSNNLDRKTSAQANTQEGQIGLVLFAGDAFTASPLTRDSETIRALVQVLDPNIMPSQGSRVDLGLNKAYELLSQAGVNNGQILLIADGVSDQEATLKVARKLRNNGHIISVIGVGTEVGGTLPNIKYQNGENITVALDAKFLQEIATVGGGKYHLMSTNNADLKSVLTSPLIGNDKTEKENEDIKSEDWKSTGPLIALLLLPLAALAFRRGWLFNVFLVAGLLGFVQPQPVYAETEPETELTFTDSLANGWNNLWINKEQQAESALERKQYNQASKLSRKPLMKGTANYKQEKYTEALSNFGKAEGADARYNEGNTLAKLERYEDAIKAYEKALELQPDMEDAQKNKTAVKEFLKKKKEQEDKKDGEGKDQKNNKNGDPKDSDSQNQKSKKGEDQDSKNGKDGKQGDQQDDKKSKNQFSDANKELDQKKENKDADENGKKSEEKNKEKSANKNGSDEEKKTEKDGNNEEQSNKIKGTNTEAEELTKEEKMAAEQWLRRIPDDPGGLLRRKFKYQYKERSNSKNNAKQPW